MFPTPSPRYTNAMSYSSLDPEAPKRPWALWALSALLAALGVANLALAADQVLNAAHYRALGVSYPPLLRALCAWVWGVAFLWLAGGLARRRRWAWRWAWPLACNYGLCRVLWLWAFAASDYGRGRVPFAFALTAAALALLGWVLRRRRIRAPLQR